MKTWWELYKKELSSIWFSTVVILLFVTAWLLFLMYKTTSWPTGLSFGLGFIPYSIFPFILLWMGYNSYRKEWKDDTIYFLLSLPRAGWKLNLAKLMAGMTFYLIVTIYTTLMVYFTQHGFVTGMMLSEAPEFITTDIVTEFITKSILFYWISGFVIFIVSQFSQLVSQFYNRFRGIVSIVVFVLANYILYRGGSLLAPIFNWIPDLPVRSISNTYAGVREMTLYIGTGPLAASALILIGLFFFGGWLLENQLEV